MYFLFSFNEHYPSGGVNDFEGTFDRIEEARAIADTAREEVGHDHYQIAILRNGSLIVIERDGEPTEAAARWV
jgi:hypothetical protein